MSSSTKPLLQILSAAVLLSSSVTAFAHLGNLGSAHAIGFEAGLMHPYGGPDHMLLAVGLGLLFSRGIKQGGIKGGLILAVMLMVGFAAGIRFDFTATTVEMGILASVVITGALLFQSRRFAPLILTGALAIFHGIAHGMELPQGASALGFMAGMVTAMTLLYVVGFGLGAIVLAHLPEGFKRHHWVEKTLAVLGVGALLLS